MKHDEKMKLKFEFKEVTLKWTEIQGWNLNLNIRKEGRKEGRNSSMKFEFKEETLK